MIVKLDATLIGLKKSIENTFCVNKKIRGQLKNLPSVINWKYIWRNYCLMFDGLKLLEPNKSLRDYGIKNKSELTFCKIYFRKKLNKQIFSFNFLNKNIYIINNTNDNNINKNN